MGEPADTTSEQKHLKEWALNTHKICEHNLSKCISMQYVPDNDEADVFFFLITW